MHANNIRDLDCIYIASDNPLSQEFWSTLQDIAPRARRVHGVTDHGMFSLARVAAQCSSTPEFLVIPSDVLPDPDFFDAVLDSSQLDTHNAATIWRCVSHINADADHDVGVGVWSREYVMNIAQQFGAESHDGNYASCLMYDCVGTEYANQTPQQAWRRGFLAALRRCLCLGRRPSVSDFRDSLPKHQLDSLSIWLNIGVDVDNGIWAMAGARQATYMTVLTAWPYQQAYDSAILEDLWNSVQHSDPRILCGQVGIELHAELALPVAMFDAEQSRFFKHHLAARWRNRGTMIRESH